MVAVHHASDLTARPRYKCIGVGCRFYQSGRTQDRWIKHAASCPHLPNDVQEAAQLKLGIQAPSLAAAKAQEELLALQNTASGIPSSQLSKSGTLTHVFSSAGRGLMQKNGDAALVKLVSAAALAPSGIKTAGSAWQEFSAALNPYYKMPTRERLEENLIPAEAQHVRNLTEKELSTEYNLTICMDGGGNRANRAFYTIHIITSGRQVRFMEARNSSGLTHDSAWLSAELLRVRSSIVWLMLIQSNAWDLGHEASRIGPFLRHFVGQHWSYKACSGAGNRTGSMCT
jgi:hypothetical protein